jgi:hypothetical protein
VWLPRVEARVERAASAADIRGAEHLHGTSPGIPWRRVDIPFIIFASSLPVAMVGIRFLS